MDNNTLILKVHVIIALLSLAIYLLRGLWMMTNNPAVTGKPALASASLSMLILLGTGVWLAFVSGTHGLDGFVVFQVYGFA
jgi:Invasion gene expression up-regulator, SirB.